MTIRIISKPFIIGATSALAAAGMGGYVWREEHRPAVLEIYVFALSNGRAVFIRTPEDKRILIDGGASSEIIRHLTGILPFYSRRIDMVIATDDEDKNISGLIDVLQRYRVDRAVIPAMTAGSLGIATSTGEAYGVFLDTIRNEKIPVEEAKAGDTIYFGKDVSASVLFPASASSFAYSKASAPEILLRISYGSTSVALLGDATKKVQAFLASSSGAAGGLSGIGIGIGQTDALYIPQSALPSNISSELMAALRPKYLIYSRSATKISDKPSAASSGKTSKEKKPPPDPLAGILMENRSNLKETGTAKIVSDGERLSVSSFK